jgi:hypothetical protein
MAIRIVRLGTSRAKGEGLRLGTVRRLPRGVKKEDYARRDFFDAWLPELAPSDALVKWIMQDAEDAARWKAWPRPSARACSMCSPSSPRTPIFPSAATARTPRVAIARCWPTCFASVARK